MGQALVGHTRAQSRSGRMCLAACASCILALGWGQAQAQQLASLPAPTVRIESVGTAKLISGWVGCDGVDAPGRHLRAKVVVSTNHLRRRPWGRLTRSD